MASISSNCLSSLSEAHDSRRTLIAFDFDHTIVEENTDIFLLRLLEGKDLPDEILSQKQSLGWTHYMGKIFQYLHSQGVKSQSIRTHMQKTPLVPGKKYTCPTYT
jgi:pyridoxal phosphate phosphatase PHOSPHO2